MIHALVLSLFGLAGPGSPTPAAPVAPGAPYLYRTTLIQAAPGKLLELVDFYKSG